MVTPQTRKLTLAERWARYQASSRHTMDPILMAVAFIIAAGDGWSWPGVAFLALVALLYWERIGYSRLIARYQSS